VTSTHRPEFDPYLHDPARWGASMAHHAELLLPCLDAVEPRTIVEVGALMGDLTRVLAHWAEEHGARVIAVDPVPGGPLVTLAGERPEVELDRRVSLEALADLPPAEAIVLDGDHNYYTVANELRLIAEAAGDRFPFVMFHDVCWPHGRRDDYFAADQIPPADRHPVGGGKLLPGDPGVHEHGLDYPRSAAREGGVRNGVLTAIEDFVDGRDDLRLAVVPAFFGFGALWDRGAPWADAVAQILDPWDRNPVLERLEANRLHHLAAAQVRDSELAAMRLRQEQLEQVLRRQLDSSAFSVAQFLSKLRIRARVAPAQSEISKAENRRALGGG
jgi:hypothetical protein